MNLSEDPRGFALMQDAAEPEEYRADVRQGVDVEVRRAFGDLAQHQGRKPRPLVRKPNEILDKAIELLGRADL
jgi:hypothetical protein